MTEDRTGNTGAGKRPANDNDPSEQSGNDGDASVPDPEALRRIDAAVLQLARLIGRRMAREDFAARIATAANDNTSDREKTLDHIQNVLTMSGIPVGCGQEASPWPRALTAPKNSIFA